MGVVDCKQKRYAVQVAASLLFAITPETSQRQRMRKGRWLGAVAAHRQRSPIGMVLSLPTPPKKTRAMLAGGWARPNNCPPLRLPNNHRPLPCCSASGPLLSISLSCRDSQSALPSTSSFPRQLRREGMGGRHQDFRDPIELRRRAPERPPPLASALPSAAPLAHARRTQARDAFRLARSRARRPWRTWLA